MAISEIKMTLGRHGQAIGQHSVQSLAAVSEEGASVEDFRSGTGNCCKCPVSSITVAVTASVHMLIMDGTLRGYVVVLK